MVAEQDSLNRLEQLLSEPVEQPELAPPVVVETPLDTQEDDKMQWYVLRTFAGFERRAKQVIQNHLRTHKIEGLVAEILVPGEDVVKTKNGKKRTTHVLYYPDYLLIKMNLTDELQHVLVNIPKISGFIGGKARKPRPLSPQELGSIKQQMTEGVKQPVVKEEFETDQMVKVIDGAFSGFQGTIDEVNVEKSHLSVMIRILGRPTPVELQFSQVQALQEDDNK